MISSVPPVPSWSTNVPADLQSAHGEGSVVGQACPTGTEVVERDPRSGSCRGRPAVWRTLRRLARSAVPAKAGSLHPHDLRHAFVTLSLDAGASLRDVQDAAGHADPRTTRRYDRARNNLDRHPTYALAGIV